MNDSQYTLWKCDSFWCGAAWTPIGVAAFDFFKRAKTETLKECQSAITSKDFPKYIHKLIKLTESYFQGGRTAFDIPLDMSAGSTFQREVWSAALKIPYGQTLSYGELARLIGNPGAARAVGTALGSNPIPVIVPCHRVLNANGGPGGFSRGLEEKYRLLTLEGIRL